MTTMNKDILDRCCPIPGPQGPPGPPGPTDLSAYVVTQTGLITTTASIEVLAAGMTFTPPAGTYLVHFSGSVNQSNASGNKSVELSIWAGGVKNNASSLLSVAIPPSVDSFDCLAIVTVDGMQAIEGRWRLTSANPPPTVANMLNVRTLTLIRII